MRSVKRFLKRQSPTILTCVGATGVVVTSVLTAKATTKASYILKEAEECNEGNLTKKEKFKVVAPVYIPAVIAGAATIGCIIGSNYLHKRQQAALVSAYTMLDQTFKEYREKVDELFGEGANEQVEDELIKDKVVIKEDKQEELFYDDFSGRYFRSTQSKVQRAEYIVNRNLVIRDYAYLNEFYDELGLPPMDNYILGWTMEQCYEMYWQSWIDFHHSKLTNEDGEEYTAIYIMEEPIKDFEDY